MKEKASFHGGGGGGVHPLHPPPRSAPVELASISTRKNIHINCLFSNTYTLKRKKILFVHCVQLHSYQNI